jgi:hypothetical protein
MRYDEVSRLFESFQCEIRRNEKAMTTSSQRRHREKNRRTGAESSMAQKPGTRTLRQGWRKAHQLAVLTSSRTWTPMG